MLYVRETRSVAECRLQHRPLIINRGSNGFKLDILVEKGCV